MADCTRCGTPLPAKPPREGVLHLLQLRRETTTHTHTLRFSRWKFKPWTEDPADQVRMFYTDLQLCTPCAGDVFLYAQGLAPVSQRSG